MDHAGLAALYGSYGSELLDNCAWTPLRKELKVRCSAQDVSMEAQRKLGNTLPATSIQSLA